MGDLNSEEKRAVKKKYHVDVVSICDFCGYPIFQEPVVDRKAGYHKRKVGENIYMGQRARKTYHQGSCAFEVMGKKKRKYKESYAINRRHHRQKIALELVLRVVMAYPKLTKEKLLSKLKHSGIKKSRLFESLRMLKTGKLIRRKDGKYSAQNKVQEAESKTGKASKADSTAKGKKAEKSRTKKHL